MAWSQDLETATFRGLSFEVVSISDRIEHRVVEHEFPYRDGAELEDTGRKARPTTVQAAFHGPNALVELAAFVKIADEGKTGTFRHPLLGTWKAKVVSTSIEHSEGKRDFAAVTIELREDGTNTEFPDVFSISAEGSKLDDAATNAQTQYDNMEKPTDPIAAERLEVAVQDAIDNSASASADLQDETSGLINRFGEIQAFVNAATVALARDVDDVEAYGTTTALRATVFGARRLKERIERIHPKVIAQDVKATAPLVVIANDRYKDPDRTDDLERINRIRNPFLVGVGETIKIHGDLDRDDQ